MSLSFLKLFDLGDAARYLIATPRPEMGSGVGTFCTFSASPRRRYPASNSLDATAKAMRSKECVAIALVDCRLPAGCGLGYSLISF